MHIRTLLEKEPRLFDELTKYWHQITGGELFILSAQGEVIKSNNGNSVFADNLLEVSDSGEIKLAVGANAILVPLESNRMVKGLLLSNNSGRQQLPMLSWIAKILVEQLNNEQALQGMTDELIAAWNQLELVYRITKTLATKSNLPDALNSILNEIINVVTVEAAFILMPHDETVGYVTVGKQAILEPISQLDFIDKLTQLDRLVLFNNPAELQMFWPQAPKTLRNFMAGVIAASEPASTEANTAVLGLVNNQKRAFTAGDVKLITAVSEQIGAIINNFKLQHELIARERVRRELEIAAEIQESLLPKTIPHINGLDIDVNMVPAYEVGGDFYDFISPDENHMTIVVGDVAGKGIPAAMFTSMVRTTLKIEAYHSQDPHIIIRRVNEALHQELWQAELFITTFVATFDMKNNVLMYANAGHTPGIIYHAQSKTSRLLKATSLPLGIYGYDYKATQYVHLSTEDVLVLYSDGVSEANNPKGERFGVEHVRDLIHQHADKSPTILKQIILRSLEEFQQTEPAADDLTLIVVKSSHKAPRSEKERNWEITERIPFEYKADTIYLTDISKQITTACRALHKLPPDSTGDDFIYLVELAVSEICTNMIEHAYEGKTTGLITGEILLTTTGVQIDIYDQGIGFDPNSVPPPISDPMDPTEGGYGLHIVRQIMDIADYEVNTPMGNHWKLVKFIPS